MKIKITGLSLKELYVKYGVGSDGFFSNDPWWKNEGFANEKPEAREYDLVLDKKTVGKTYEEQLSELEKGFEVPHVAIVVEAILAYFAKTGERLLDDWYVRTATLDSDGNRVNVGNFDAKGLHVDSYWGGDRDGDIGLSAVRKLGISTTNSCQHPNLYFERCSLHLVNENGVNYMPDGVRTICADCGVIIKEVRIVK